MLVARTRRPKRTSRKRSWRQRGRILGLFATILSVAAIVILAGPSRMAMTGPAQKGIAPPEVSAKSVFVLNADTGRVLYEKNPDEVFRILSLTKLVTAYILVDRMGDRLSETIKINWPHLTGGSSASELGGSTWTGRPCRRGWSRFRERRAKCSRSRRGRPRSSRIRASRPRRRSASSRRWRRRWGAPRRLTMLSPTCTAFKSPKNTATARDMD